MVESLHHTTPVNIQLHLLGLCRSQIVNANPWIRERMQSHGVSTTIFEILFLIINRILLCVIKPTSNVTSHLGRLSGSQRHWGKGENVLKGGSGSKCLRP